MRKTRQTFLEIKSRLAPTLTLLAQMVLILVLVLILPVRRALAQPWYLPTEGADSVSIENTSKEPHTVWFTGPADQDNSVTETNIELGPNETKSIELKEQKNWPWLQIKSYEKLPVKVTVYSKNSKTKVNPGRSEVLSTDYFSSKTSGTLFLSNLSPLGQENIKIKTSPRNAKNVQLGKFESTKIHLDLNIRDKITVQADYPVSAMFISDSVLLHLTPIKSQTHLQPESKSIYFVMVNPEHDQSFIFKADNQDLINEARKQIAKPDQRKILFAKIQKGHAQMNRDLENPLRTVWSWSVEEVRGFGMFGSQECDGSPQLVEDYLIPWLNSQKNICFWGYRIQRELNPEEIQTGDRP